MNPTTPRSNAGVLRHLANHIDAGLPEPIAVTLGVHDHPAKVQVRADDLPAWLTLMEVVPPEWEWHKGGRVAKWPDDAFDGCPFTLAAYRSASEAVTS